MFPIPRGNATKALGKERNCVSEILDRTSQMNIAEVSCRKRQAMKN